MTPTNEAGHGLPEFLPCPFCGKSDTDKFPCEWLDWSGANVIRCAWCHGAAPAKSWNRRATAALGLSRGVPDGLSEVTRQLIERDQRGRQKYGATLDRADLSLNDWLQHMAEELMDAAGYALAAKRTAPAAAGAQGEVAHVTIDFPQVGTAGPFKVINGRMTLPDVTMNDLIHHARTGYVPAPQPAAADGGVRERAREIVAFINGRCTNEEAGRKCLGFFMQYGEHLIRALSSHRQAGDGDPVPNVIHDFKKLRFGVERVIHELRTYWPAADEYKGEHIHKVWARELESLLALVEKGAGNG